MRNLASLSPDHCHSAASVPLVFWSVRDDCPRFCTVCATYLCATLHARHQPHPHIPLHVVNHNCITCYAAPFSAAAFRWQQSRSLQRHHRECRRPPGFHIPRSGRVRWPSRSWVVWASDENKQAKKNYIFHCTMKFRRVECARVHHHVPIRLPHHTPSNVDGSSSTFW